MKSIGALKDQKGAILIWVLWILAAVSVLAFLILGQSRNLSGLASAEIHYAQRRHALEGAVHQAIATYFNEGGERIARTYSISIADIGVTVDISSEGGRIDLNHADEDLLSALFGAYGFDTVKAQRLAAALADWRDDDELAREYGAETIDYLRKGVNVKPRNGHFQSIGEIAHVLDMPSEAVPCLGPSLTVYSQGNRIDPSEAVPEVRRVFSWATQRHWMGGDWTLSDDGDSVLNPVQNRSGTAVRFEARLNTPAGASQNLIMIIRRTSSGLKGFETLLFRYGSTSLDGVNCQN